MRLLLAIVAVATIIAGGARAADAPPAETRAMPMMTEQALVRIEAEIVADAKAIPEIPQAVSREWRSLDRNGSALGVLVGLGWVAIATIVALLAERGTLRLLGRRPRVRMREREGGPTLGDMAILLVCDLVALAVFMLVFAAQRRHWLEAAGVTTALATFATNVVIRWRVVAVVLRAILRPDEAVARLIEVDDAEARRLYRFVSVAVLAIIVIVGFGRYGLMDEDSGAAHVVSLCTALLVFVLYAVIVFRTRAAMEALIRGRRVGGLLATVRAAVARAWLAIALGLFACVMVIYVAGLSLDLLGYYHAVTQTLGILFVVIVLDRLTERVWHDEAAAALTRDVCAAQLQARTAHRIIQAIGLAGVVWALASIWIEAIDASEKISTMAMHSATATIGTLFVAFIAWELVRLAIDRHLVGENIGPGVPGGDDDEEITPASRLQTVLPMLRAAFAVVIGVLAALIVLSRLGVDTAPLIAGAGVFGLALSFGSQSLVRDIISGLFYMWDDAFRVGEYIDTGRLKGTVETLGIRSVKLRHQNGPLHTIPYGQLGAVTNLSRDFATIKFNLRFVPGTDIELVRKTTKQLGLTMQAENAELAAEVMAPLKLQGIAEVVDSAVVLRFKFTARPVKPSWVQREYLKRMVAAFAEKGIQFASGAVYLQQIPLIDTPPQTAAAPSSQPADNAAALSTAAAVGLGAAAVMELADMAAPANTTA